MNLVIGGMGENSIRLVTHGYGGEVTIESGLMEVLEAVSPLGEEITLKEDWESCCGKSI